MRILFAGGTGFLGRHLIRHLAGQGHTVTVLARRPYHLDLPNVTVVRADPMRAEEVVPVLAGHQAVVNLVGRPILCRWTRRNKAAIQASRLLSTSNLASAIAKAGNAAPKVLVNASAVGYYGDRGDEPLNEEAPAGTDFLAQLAVAWEKAALQAADAGCRIVCLRLGVVLGPDGGALAAMLPAYRFGLGSPLGSGRQWFAWLHIADCCRIVLAALENEQISGPVNCVASTPLRQRDFSRALAAALHRPHFLPAVPAIVLRFLLGEMATVLLASQRAAPTKLLQAGFSFLFPEIHRALASILTKNSAKTASRPS